MEFLKIATLFQSLEKRNKRLEKILLIRDFILENNNKVIQSTLIERNIKTIKETHLVLDIIVGNFQREIDKKKLAISLKTIFQVLAFLSRKTNVEIEQLFNRVGDVGLVAIEVLKNEQQTSLLNKKLDFKDIVQSLQEISKISGINSNKKKKEILTKLFMSAKTKEEYKFLARLLIDDLRIGVSVGVLKEACVNAYFPQIIGIHQICSNCSYVNLNLKECIKCKTKIETKNQEELATSKFIIVELETPKKEIGLNEFGIKEDIDIIEFSIRRDRTKQILHTKEPRKIYSTFLKNFEKKYNLINSFTKILKELDEDLNNILKFEIKIGIPILSMLGTRSQSVEESFGMTSTPALLDYKYDGLRVQIHNNYGQVSLFSRNLDEITKQFPEVIDFIKTNFSDLSFVIDSECVGYDFNKQDFLPFQILSRRILTKNIDTVSHINVVVKAFDLLSLNGKTLINEHYEKRREMMEDLMINRKLKQKLHFNIDKISH